MMASVTHEVVEAASDPLPLAHWMDESTGTRGDRFDPSHIETLLTEGEISDICHSSTVSFTDSGGTTVEVADYWSNADNACLSLDAVPPTTTATLIPSTPSGWANTNVTVNLTATDVDRRIRRQRDRLLRGRRSGHRRDPPIRRDGERRHHRRRHYHRDVPRHGQRR